MALVAGKVGDGIARIVDPIGREIVVVAEQLDDGEQFEPRVGADMQPLFTSIVARCVVFDSGVGNGDC